MKKLLSFFVPVLLCCVLFSCEKKENRPGDPALVYFNHLIEGRYEKYVESIAYSDSMTDDYRRQMVDLAAQYAATEKETRGGLVSAKVLSDTVMQEFANVFLEVTFGDQTKEEISIPLVLCGEQWKLQ